MKSRRRMEKQTEVFRTLNQERMSIFLFVERGLIEEKLPRNGRKLKIITTGV